MPSLTVENYAKAIYQICARRQKQPASTGEIAELLGVLPGTVTSMLKTLADAGLAKYTPYEGVQLTDAGRALALRVLRRHRLIELFLAETLNLAWDEVHEEAENMEHAVSDRLVDRMERYLEYPETDPHGDPIPSADGTLPSADPTPTPLAEWNVGAPFRLVRVLDQSPQFLRYLSDAGLPLGVEGRVAAHQQAAQTVIVEVGRDQTTLARTAAEKLLVRALP